MSHKPYNITEEQITCLNQRQWWMFLLASLGTYFGALFLYFILKIITVILRSCCCPTNSEEKSQQKDQLGGSSFGAEIQEWAASLISGQTTTGRLLVMFLFICNIVAVAVYIIDTNTGLMEECGSWVDSVTIQIDFALGVVFTMGLLLRYIAAESTLSFLLELMTIIDLITLPPLFLSVWSERTWIGLRFFRCLFVVQLPNVLVYLRLLTNSSSIRLTQLVSNMLGGLLVGGGMFYLLENSGDPFHDYLNAREIGELRYGDALYWCVITASTVGYGDYFPTTDLGKLFSIFYLSVAIASFASNLPEVAELMGNQPKYDGSFKSSNQRQYVVVCGNINYESVNSFLKDFFHPAREDVNCEVVFLNKNEPDLEFEGLLKREKTRVSYFQGTMLSPFDLQRVGAEKAAAVLVLCNKFSPDPSWEDAANIMRVISLKNYCENTRVVVQLLHYSSKSFLLNIPGWDWRRDDQAVCLNEVKFGLLAQSCLAPGLFTIASNIVTTTGIHEIRPEMARWKKQYFASMHKVILADTLSPTFVGSTFEEVAEICFTKLNLILIAVEARKYEGGEILICPKNKRISVNAIGLFLAESSDAAKRAWFYCRVCHENINDVNEIRKCSCKKLAKARYDYYNYGRDKNDQVNGMAPAGSYSQQYKEDMLTDNQDVERGLRRRKLEVDTKSDDGKGDTAKMTYDSTGCFHWCSGRTIDECSLTRQEATVTMFAGHIVIAIFADEDSPMLGLRNLVMPLRASNINYNDIRHIIIIGKINYIKREWYLLKNLPKISVLDGDPLSRADLRAAKVNLCRTCIILSAKTPEKSEPALADKEIIMAALNIKYMNFGADFIKMDEFGEEAESSDINIHNVPILLDLAFAINVRYLDEQEMYMSDVELYKTLPFAGGVAMARGLLDSLMSATYFNASALRLLRQWVTGGANIDLEKSLAEGAGLRGGYTTPKLLAARDRARVEEIVLRDSQWSRYADFGARFSDLFASALRDNGTLCIGIYRMLDEDNESETVDDTTRFVIGCPNNDTLLQPMDHIIALVQFDPEKEKSE